MKPGFWKNILHACCAGVTALLGMFAAASVSAQNYRDCSNALSQLDATFCAKEGWEAVDAELNALWRIIKPQADAAGWGQSLLNEQRGWLKYRDAICEGERAQFQGGSIAPQVYWSCMDRLTRIRNYEFRSLL
ncbi:MAG: lysozyme inhibitor LprI family protein [Sulfitobacter sp.]